MTINIDFDEDLTCGQLRRKLVAAGIAPIRECQATSDSEWPVLISAENVERHGLTRQAVLLTLSEWSSSTPAGTHDGIRDGAQNGRCRRRFRAYYRPEDVIGVLSEEDNP